MKCFHCLDLNENIIALNTYITFLIIALNFEYTLSLNKYTVSK